MQNQEFAKMRVSRRKTRVVVVLVAENIPLFRCEVATASHLDGHKLAESLGNTPPALNAKPPTNVFF